MPPSLVPRIMRKKPFSPQYLTSQSSVDVACGSYSSLKRKVYIYILYIYIYWHFYLVFIPCFGVTAHKNATNEEILATSFPYRPGTGSKSWQSSNTSRHCPHPNPPFALHDLPPLIRRHACRYPWCTVQSRSTR